jgi:hypothetical protein
MFHAPRSFAAVGSAVVVLGSLAVLAAAEKRDSEQAATKTTGSPKVAGSSSSPVKGDADRAAGRKYVTQTVRGKVVWLDEALKRLYGIATEPAAAQTAVALEVPPATLIPITPDTRGQAFVVDQRLRNVELELLVRRYEGSPYVQVIRVRKRTAEGLREIDYWCDVCAIRMYILKACECCQGPTRLREEPVEAGEDSAP